MEKSVIKYPFIVSKVCSISKYNDRKIYHTHKSFLNPTNENASILWLSF